MPRKYKFTRVKNEERKKQAAKAQSSANLHSMMKDTITLENGWVDATCRVDMIHLCKCVGISQHSHDIIIKTDLTWDVYIHGRKVRHGPFGAPALLQTIENVKDLVQTIETASICPGNPDEKFVEMIKARHKQKGISVNGEVGAQVDSYPACVL